MKKNYKRDLQLKVLEIAKNIDEICKKNNIDYYIIYGSALGAVRHKGFIPWDDDFDIGMTYENYQKFIKICEKELDKNKYFLQTPETEEKYYLSFAKLRDITTTLVEEANKDKEITYGVYVDIFPLVGVPKNKIRRKILEINRAFAISANTNIINNKYLYTIFKIILKIVGKEKLLNICRKNCVKYSCNDHEDWCSIFDGDSIKSNMTTKEIMGTPTRVPFEDTYLPIPEKYDEYLRNIYNDYMKIPSKKEIKQREHTPYILDLEHSYSEYLKLNKEKR